MKTNHDQLYRDFAKRVRNRLRKYKYESVLHGLAWWLSEKVKSHDDLKYTPWVVERMALWVLVDDPCFYGNKLLDQNGLVDAINFCRNEHDKLPVKEIGGSLHLFLRQLFLSQLPYQVTSDFYAFTRQFEILDGLQKSSYLIREIESYFSIDYERLKEMLCVSWVLLCTPEAGVGAFQQKMVPLFGIDLVSKFSKKIFFEAKDVKALSPARDKVTTDEWWQPTCLYKFPIVKRGDVLYLFGIVNVRRYLEYFLFDFAYSKASARAKSLLDKGFNQYIGNIFNVSFSKVLDETGLKSEYGVCGKVCDFAIIENGFVLLVEVKNKHLTDEMPALAEVNALNSKLKGTVLKGVEQLENVEKTIINSDKDLDVVGVILTSGDMVLGSDYLAENERFVISATDMERMCEIIRAGRDTLKGMFDKIRVKHANPETKQFVFGQYLNIAEYSGVEDDYTLARVNKIMDKLASKFSS
ncbi:hypothetical protein [Aquitalea sp. ASV15]|uniref:hypothetical protein n=1 Tax=Aquitalea sp. ASV15 TaxID=2795104 RepID=UPI0018ED4945|nr:hypothetical protein [Aquitalea sp. ASV15]